MSQPNISNQTIQPDNFLSKCCKCFSKTSSTSVTPITKNQSKNKMALANDTNKQKPDPRNSNQPYINPNILNQQYNNSITPNTCLGQFSSIQQKYNQLNNREYRPDELLQQSSNSDPRHINFDRNSPNINLPNITGETGNNPIQTLNQNGLDDFRIQPPAWNNQTQNITNFTNVDCQEKRSDSHVNDIRQNTLQHRNFNDNLLQLPNNQNSAFKSLEPSPQNSNAGRKSIYGQLTRNLSPFNADQNTGNSYIKNKYNFKKEIT